MISELLAGIDVGSSNCKVEMYTAAGERVAQLSRPTAGDRDALVRGVLEDLAGCAERAGAPPAAVGIASMAESGVEPDGFPEVRRPTGIVVEPHLNGRGAPARDPGRRLALHGVTTELPRNRDRVARYQRICSDEFLAEAKR